MVLESLNPRWVSSIMLGVVNEPQFPVPPTALGFKKNAWIISADSVFQDGEKVSSSFKNYDCIPVQKTGVMLAEPLNASQYNWDGRQCSNISS